MGVSVQFFSGSDFQINDLAGSGLGFYGSDAFGASVRVGEYQGRTFITNSAGTAQGPEADNVKFLNSASGILGQTGSGIALRAVPNYLSTLKIRTQSDAGPITTMNNRIRIYDRVDPANPPSGVTCKAAQVIHPSTTQVLDGSGDVSWTTFGPALTGISLSLAPSPGVSGLYAGNGTNSTKADTVHDHHVVLSASPDSVGSKSFGLYFETEYL